METSSNKADHRVWNSLELTKLIVSLITPLAVVVFGLLIQTELRNQDHLWQQEERLVDTRLQVYLDVGPQLNRIYCFVQEVGTWKEDTPEDVVGLKRAVDQEMYSMQAIWSPQAFQAYQDYMNSAFQTGIRWAGDAKIKAFLLQRQDLPSWNKEWNDLLTDDRDPKHKAAYDHLIQMIFQDFGGARVDS